MSFSLPRLRRHTPTESLKSYFAARSFADMPDLDWATEAVTLHDQLVEGALQAADRDRLHGEFGRAGLLCDEIGQGALPN